MSCVFVHIRTTNAPPTLPTGDHALTRKINYPYVKTLSNPYLYLVLPLCTGCILMEEGASPLRKCPKTVSKRFFVEDIFVHLEYTHRKGGASKMISTTSLKELEAQKARELKEIQQYQASAVEASLKKKEQALLELQQKFQQLRNDFEYNLKLLEERDKELAQYDEVFEQLKNIINNKSAEISELHIHIDQLTNQIASFGQDKADLKQHYTKRVAELQQQTTSFQQQCHANADKERLHYEQLCAQLQMRLRQCEEESERIREESGRDLEELLRRKEQDHRIKVDEMVSMVMSKESQVCM